MASTTSNRIYNVLSPHVMPKCMYVNVAESTIPRLRQHSANCCPIRCPSKQRSSKTATAHGSTVAPVCMLYTPNNQTHSLFKLVEKFLENICRSHAERFPVIHPTLRMFQVYLVVEVPASFSRFLCPSPSKFKLS